MVDISNMHTVEPKIDEYLERVYRISRSFGTKRSYHCTLKKFEKFCNCKSSLPNVLYDLKNGKQDPIDVLDEFYSFLSKQHLKNSTIIGNLSVTKDYLNFHGMKIYSEDIKQKFRTPKPDVFYEEGLTKSTLNRLLQNCVPKLRVAILMACSSGMRVGEIAQLRLSDVDFTTNPTTIRVRRETTKTRETRFTHISTEASKLLSDYITKKTLNTQSLDPYLFMYFDDEFGSFEYYKSMFAARQTLMERLRETVLHIPELSMKNENGQNRIHFHAFRKWFKTQVTTAGQSDFAEALMGHKSLKLVYFKQSTEARQKMYQQMEPFLTLSDFTRVEKTMEDLQGQVQSLSLELEKVKQWRDISVKYQKR
ncbi:MAG: site-specific integrase [Nitrosarchaeum sp.]|nr:site-specific integrase [Nitrosarchaeum sp.]